MRNLLEEFHQNHGIRPATILGVREHVFTGRYVSVETSISLIWVIMFFFAKGITCDDCSVSSLASFMSNQETSFVTLGQRVLANPLK